MRLGGDGIAAIGAAIVVCGCTAEPRPQLLMIVDTDAPTVGQLRDDPAISSDAVVDTVRVDFISGGEPYATETFTVTETLDWPLSFGVRSPSELAGEVLQVRIRAFRGALANIEQLGDETEFSPATEVAIDRLVEITLPSDGVLTKRLRLALACLGRPPTFLSPAHTCVDEARLDVLATEGLDDDDDREATAAGSSEIAREQPCVASARGDRVCVPGGFFLLGDNEIMGIGDILRADAVPLRPARVSPFWLDRTEVTIAAVRQLSSELTTPLPLSFDAGIPAQEFCTWLGSAVDTNDALPVNCVTWETAREVCQLRGGDLPTEAQWEHAASGRGQSRRYPWGDDAAECCSSSLDRQFVCQAFADSVEPAGSHPRDGCAGPADVSRDGVLDTGGSVAEWMRDRFREYGDEDGCWAYRGIGGDPFCDEEGLSRSERGGSWAAGLGTALVALRARGSGPAATTGFRCSYEDTDG